MSDVDKFTDFDSYMTGMTRANSNALIQVIHLPKIISKDGKWVTISVDNWWKFVNRITGRPKKPDDDDFDEHVTLGELGME